MEPFAPWGRLHAVSRQNSGGLFMGGKRPAPSFAGTGVETPYYRLSAFELATSWVPGVRPLGPLPDTVSSARIAFESAVRPALLRPPCYVSFSGGRDSSAVLAVATHIARREGLADPVPVTEVYPGIDAADESHWQRLVIDHLGLHEWTRISISGESDLLGAAAQASLLRRGVLWPPSFHVKDALFATASGGTLLTGEGGDEVIGPRRVTPVTLLVRKRRRPRPALLRAVTAALAPAPLRRAWLRRDIARSDQQPWLRPSVAREHRRQLAADEAAEPLSWGRAIRWVRHRRAVDAVLTNYQALGTEHDVVVGHPLLDDGFLAALAGAGGRWGFAGRTALMRILFADVLPDEILRRSTKASFDRAYMGEATRDFARGWDGTGVDTDLVDPETLRAAWLSDHPSTLSGTLLQQAWLASR
ncbi:asparagine synthase-related protein [Jiangella asiatica]|uniref:asparagine synthase-related protein n=1 Tax=Jiangella asiatica TaxID=2530372 RepID=UPI0013A5C191|nr:asparagine synthase-related protein [Jiangella asiatica]